MSEIAYCYQCGWSHDSETGHLCIWCGRVPTGDDACAECEARIAQMPSELEAEMRAGRERKMLRYERQRSARDASERWAEFQRKRDERRRALARSDPPPITTVGSYPLRMLRKALALGLDEVAEKMARAKCAPEKLERLADLNHVSVDKLHRYIRALGGELELNVVFPRAVRASLSKELLRLAKEERQTAPSDTKQR